MAAIVEISKDVGKRKEEEFLSTLSTFYFGHNVKKIKRKQELNSEDK